MAQSELHVNNDDGHMAQRQHASATDQVNLERIRDLDEENTALKRNLQANVQDFKDLLAELDTLRRDVQGKDSEIRDL